MPASWTFRGTVLTLSVTGVVTNQEIETAIGEAIANAPSRSGLRLLWDARDTQTPLTAEDVEWRWRLVSSLARRGVLSRAALLLRPDQGAFHEFVRLQMWKALPSLEIEAFADEGEALAWLER
jgi:hypothetical protein